MYLTIPMSQLLFLVSVSIMVINTTFNNISVISWLLVLLVEETGVPCLKSLTNFIYTSYERDLNSQLEW